MSRFMPDALGLGLSTGRAVLGVLPAAVTGMPVLAAYRAPVPALTQDAADGLAAPAQNLPGWLRAQPLARKRVNVTLSNTCVHHLLVPNNRAVASYRERDGYARAMVEEAFGIDGGAWHIAADDNPFAKQFLAVAAPRALLDGTQAAVLEARGKPGSTQSFFAREWNAHRSHLAAACWFAVIEPDCTVIARVQRRRLASLRTLRQALDTPEALLQAVEREALTGLVDDVPQSIYVTGAALFAQAVTQATSSTRSFTLHRLDAVAPLRFAALDRTQSRLLWNA